MPQVLFLVAAGVAAYTGYRWLSRHLSRDDGAAQPGDGQPGHAQSDKGRATAGGEPAPRDLGTLEWDPSVGAYRPKRTG